MTGHSRVAVVRAEVDSAEGAVVRHCVVVAGRLVPEQVPPVVPVYRS